jgi:carbon monoxide dehydrogenase subunit G
MELEHSFTVPVPEDRAWEVLLDVERVAPCMPGASLDSVDGDVISGRIKVKVGPIAMTYAGTARFTERDPHARVVTLEASGKETRGAGTAAATVRSMLEGRGDRTHVIVHTTLNVTGRPAQFGRGVMAEVGGKLIGIFATNLAQMLTADGSPAAPGDTAAGAQTPAGPADAAAAAGPAAESGDQAAGELDQPVEELQLSLRSYNSLRKEGIHTVGDLTSRTGEELLAIEKIGPASVEEIRQKLAARGLSLSESVASANGVSAVPRQAAAPAPPRLAEAPPAPPRLEEPPQVPPPLAEAPPAAPGLDTRPPDDDAIDLLSVAGMPVLKRALPVAAAAGLTVLVVLGLRRRRRQGRS